MTNTSPGRVGIVVLVVALTVTAATTPVAILTASAANPTDSIPDDRVFDGTDDGQIQVWERAGFPLRTDDTGAATQVPLPGAQAGGVFGEELGDGNTFTDNVDDGVDSKSLVATFGTEKNPAGAHNSGTIDISFDASRAESSNLDGQGRVDFFAARVTGEGGQGFPDDYSDAVTLYGSVENANANLSFNSIEEGVSLDSDGTYDTSYDFSPGHWIVYAVVNNNNKNGFEVDNNNNISVDGDVVIVGADIVSVHEAKASVTAPKSIVAGTTANFDVDTTNAFGSSKDGQVTHAVAIYKKDTFEESRFDMVINNSKLGPNFNASNGSQLEHTIENVQGVADVEDGIEINGRDLSDGRVESTGNLGLAAIIDRFASDLGTNDPATDPIGSTVINASVNASSSMDRDTTIAVDTLDDFRSGTYQYVVVSQLDGDATKTSTRTGTLEIDQPTVTADLGTANANSFTRQKIAGSSKVNKVGIKPGAKVTVKVSELTSIPSGTTTNDIKKSLSNRNVEQTVLTIDISINKSDSSATVELTIPKSAFSGNPNNLRVSKFNSVTGSYEGLSTSVVSETADNVTISFTPNSFSTFVVSQTSKVSSGDDGPTAGGGGGGGGGAITEEPQKQVDSQKSQTDGGETATATVTSANAGERVRVNTDTSTEDGGARVESVDIEFAEEVQNANVQVSTTNTKPDTAPDPDPTQTGDTIGYVETTVEGASESAIGQSTFTFRVSDQRLEQADTSPDNIRLYRIQDGQANGLPTEHVGGNRFQSTTPGFSVFVIGTEPADISFVSGELDRTSVGVGESFTTAVTVSNDGGNAGDVELTLEANGDALTSETVTVRSDRQAQVDLTASIDQSGTYDITVNGNAVGTLEVLAEGETPSTPEGTPTATPEGPAGEPGEGTPTAGTTPTATEAPGVFGPGFGMIVALLALLGASLVALRRRQQ